MGAVVHGIALNHIFRTDLGDDKGDVELVCGRVPGTVYRRGDDDVEILMPRIELAFSGAKCFP